MTMDRISADTLGVEVLIAGLPGPLGGPAWTPQPDLRAAVVQVLDTFGTRPDMAVASARVALDRTAHQQPRCVTLYRLEQGREVFVVGDEDLAAGVREVLPCNGWRLHDLPRPGTPLSVIREALGPRLYSMLPGEGITTVEELGAIPDAGLFDMRLVSVGSIERIRAAVAGHATALPAPAEPVTLTGDHVQEVRALLGILGAASRARGERTTSHRVEAVLAVLDAAGAERVADDRVDGA